MKDFTKENLNGKRVLVRVDFNVPLRNGKVLDDTKIIAHKETIQKLLEMGAKVVLISHLGRPKGKKVKEFSLKQIQNQLEIIIQKTVTFIPEVCGKKVEEAIENLNSGEIMLLENVRYEGGEELNDLAFAEKLAKLGDIFVQDAFANSHRAHASMVGIAKFLPSYPGLLLKKEIEGLDNCLVNPRKPFVCIIGGAKISSKIEVLKSLAHKADIIIIGGGMANTFLAAEGYDIGESLVEKELIDEAEEVLREAYDQGVEVLLPDDVVVAKSISEKAKTTVKDINNISKTDIIVDLGPKSVSKFAQPIKFAGTIFWNGPMGITEIKQFSKDTVAIARIIEQSGACTVVGGGDTLAVIKDEMDRFTFVSTGGGATMEYIKNDGKLPGIEVLGLAK